MPCYDPAERERRVGARLVMALLRLSQAVKRLTLAEAAEAALTPVQAQTLLFVRYTKPFLASVSRLAQALGATHVTALGVVDGLVRRGLLVKEASADDRRVTLLRLTERGAAVCQRLEHFGHTLEEALGSLDEEEQRQLEGALGRLVWSLWAAGALQVAEPCRGCAYFVEDAAAGAPEPHYCRLIARHLSEQDARRDCPDHTPPALLAYRVARPRRAR